jgi:hypothetical protein
MRVANGAGVFVGRHGLGFDVLGLPTPRAKGVDGGELIGIRFLVGSAHGDSFLDGGVRF